MSKNSLDNYEYDNHLAQKAGRSREARQELVDRKTMRKSKGFEGWHWGLGDTPVKVRDKVEFKRELETRGLMMKDEVKRDLR